MASGVMKFNDYFRAYYLKKRAQGSQHRKAMIALLNKLLRTFFSILSNNQLFIQPSIPLPSLYPFLPYYL
jgi:hypothetical protein